MHEPTMVCKVCGKKDSIDCKNGIHILGGKNMYEAPKDIWILFDKNYGEFVVEPTETKESCEGEDIYDNEVILHYVLKDEDV